MDRRKTLVEVTVYLSPAEYDQLQRQSAFIGEGTVFSAIRCAAGLPATPVGWLTANRDGSGYAFVPENTYLEQREVTP
jgi:hypothetical protein